MTQATKVLLIGGGAREHAMARALVESGAAVHVVMKNLNPGLAELAEAFVVATETDPDTVVEHATTWGCELALCGPEAPIQAGVTDALAEAGLRLASPTQAAGRIETDKAWMRTLQAKHDLPGSLRCQHFATEEGLADFVRELGEVAVKPIGLTGGKGVKVTGEQLDDVEAAVSYAEEIVASEYGGGEVVIEEKLIGEEFTVQCFTDGTTVLPTPAVQDHKRAFEGDEGPNTGGMGAYSDKGGLLPFLNQEDYDAAVAIVQAHVDALREEGHTYKGTVYGQFMLTAEGPKVIEMNARFGDPEAMNTLTVLDTPYLE
ncbi:MAG: phosphoribosylamine--glycine ligase, partial [Candidatus Thermoplasmatota archaeon]|nr:phosphoribosylamine--glycine ligase [Candidatus Thermoplasmatota archaeon]